MVIPSTEDEEAQADLLDTPMETTVMVNAQNILKVADAIATKSIPGLGFNMDFLVVRDEDLSGIDWNDTPDCGTVACIAGWANALVNKLDNPRFERAAEFLGLDTLQSDQLFYARNHPDAKTDDWGDTYAPLADIPAHQAVRTLRHLAATGEVDWTV